MKIAILNECFLDKDHLVRLKKLGEVKIFPNTKTEEDAIKRLKGVDIAIVDGFECPLNKKVLSSADKLKFLVLPHTGYFMVDLEVASEKGIKVANAPGFSKQAVAELVIGLMFAVNRRIPLIDREMRQNPFQMDPANVDQQRKYWGFDIKGKTIGVIGLGRIGEVVAELALGLGMKVIAHNRSPKRMKGVEMVNLDELLKKSDVVSINVTSGKDTEKFISERELKLMKPTAILINVDQAAQVDTEALYKALNDKKIAGAGLDYVDVSKGHPIFKLDNVVILAHNGSYTNESFRQILPDIIVSDIEAFVKGYPINIVN